MDDAADAANADEDGSADSAAVVSGRWSSLLAVVAAGSAAADSAGEADADADADAAAALLLLAAGTAAPPAPLLLRPRFIATTEGKTMRRG